MSVLAALALGIAVGALALAAVTPVRDTPVALHTRTPAARAAFAAWLRSRREASRAGASSLDILQATAAALRSGLPLGASLRIAIERAAKVPGEPYLRLLRAIELNARVDETLRDAAEEATDRRAALAFEALALVAAEQLPATRAASIVASVADRMAFDARLLDEIRARTSGVRAQIVLLALLVPALALYLVATMPGLAATLASPLGRYVLVPAAAIFETVGIVASRAIVRDLAR